MCINKYNLRHEYDTNSNIYNKITTTSNFKVMFISLTIMSPILNEHNIRYIVLEVTDS